jgi:hypothetical protein
VVNRLNQVLGIVPFALLGALTSACAQQAGSVSSAEPAPLSSTPSQVAATPLSSDPNPCNGVKDVAAAYRLVNGGQSVALVSVTISEPPGEIENNARLLRVEASTLLAGQLPDGEVRVVEAGSTPNGPEVLPPGKYLILVGRTSSPATYFLSDGLRGSFTVEGDRAFERCPNADDPSAPGVVREGVTSIPELTALFAASFKGSRPEGDR